MPIFQKKNIENTMLSIFPRIRIVIIRAVITPFQIVDDRSDSACGLGGFLKMQLFKQFLS